jgi:hypothetical protein
MQNNQINNANLAFLPYKNVDNTLLNIFALILQAQTPDHDYLEVFNDYSIKQVYDFVKAIPYVLDPQASVLNNGDDIELLKAPWATILLGGDCDCKSILQGSILMRKNIPFHMAVVSTIPSKELHHIYPEIYINDSYVPFDATYPDNDLNHIPSQIFQVNPYTRKKLYFLNNNNLISYEEKKNLITC